MRRTSPTRRGTCLPARRYRHDTVDSALAGHEGLPCHATLCQDVHRLPFRQHRRNLLLAIAWLAQLRWAGAPRAEAAQNGKPAVPSASVLPASRSEAASDGSFPYAGNVARYFPAAATLVTRADRATLQRVLDAKKIVRLEAGDYGDTNIVIRSDHELYGVPAGATVIGSITIEAGARNFLLKGVSTNFRTWIRFPPSAVPTSDGCITMCDNTGIQGDQATVERLLVASAFHSSIEFDNVVGGHLRNARFLRVQTHNGGHPSFPYFGNRSCFNLTGKGDRSSYGNCLAVVNALGSYKNQVSIQGQADFALLAMDTENYEAVRDGKAAVYLRNCGMVRINSVSGGTRDQKTLDNGADDLFVSNFILDTNVPYRWTVQSNARRMMWMGSGSRYTDTTDFATVKLRVYQEQSNQLFKVNGAQVDQLTGANAAEMLDFLLKEPAAYTRWGKPTLRSVPDPGGASWADGRESAASHSAQLQAILDANRAVAYLPAGRFIIGTPLRYHRGQIIVGSGSDRTHLIAKTRTTKIFTSAWGTAPAQTFGANSFLDMTLQGGDSGIYQGEAGIQLSGFNLSHIVFRDMATAGIHLQNTFAWDNGWIAQCDFVNCGAGVRQQGFGVAEQPTVTYMDKTNFFRCQFIACGIALDMSPARPNNLDTWTECYFKACATAVLKWRFAHNVPFFINCVFDGNAGNPTCDGGGFTIYYVGCDFIGTPGGAGAFVDSSNCFEGCTFSRNGGSATLLAKGSRDIQLVNCALGDVPLGATALNTFAVNSSFAAVDNAFQKPISAKSSAAPQFNWLDGPVAPGTRLIRGRQ